MKKPHQQPNTQPTAEDYYRRAGQHRTAVRSLWGDFVVSFFFAAAALIVLVFFSIAWFVSNTRVNGSTAAVAAKDGTNLLLASEGVRQTPEETHLQLSLGTEKTYDSYYDCTDKTTKNESIKLYTGTSGLAWCLNGQQNLFPGEENALELYFIPQQSGLKKVELTLTAVGYRDKKDANGNEATVEPIEDNIATPLLNSHILFFTKKDANGFYSGLLGVNGDSYGTGEKTVTLNAVDFELEKGEFAVNTPYKVTIYWKWPKLLRNYIFNDAYYNDLFSDADITAEHQALLEYLNENRSKTTTETGSDGAAYYATGIFLKKVETAANADEAVQATADEAGTTDGISIGNIGKSITAADLSAADEYYNQADEYLGSNVEYVFVKVEANAAQQ